MRQDIIGLNNLKRSNMNNLEKEFIPYEQALALKELGFDEPCLCSWNFFTNELNFNGQPSTFSSEDVIQLPTFSQAFRWFREKYKIRFIIQSSMSDLGEYFKVIFPNGEQRGVSYNTYEEAELAVIVKLIEIVKKK